VRRFVLWWAALALCCAPALAGAGALQGVTFELGGGYASLSPDDGDRAGGGGFFGASAPLRPWVSIGGELGYTGFRKPTSYDPYGGSVVYDRTTLATLMATFRLMPPIRCGVGPFLVSQTGVAMARWGAAQQYISPNAVGLTVRARADYVFCSAIGFGLRGTWPRPAPGFELSVRSVMLGGENPRTMFAPRLSLTY
jgi:hypothetical protein